MKQRKGGDEIKAFGNYRKTLKPKYRGILIAYTTIFGENILRKN